MRLDRCECVTFRVFPHPSSSSSSSSHQSANLIAAHAPETLDCELSRGQSGLGEEADEQLEQYIADSYDASEFVDSVPIAEGGYGSVLAVQHQGGEWMALKLCLDPDSAKQKEALQSEIEIMRRITHCNILEFRGLFVDGFDVDEDGAPRCAGFLMECCPQASLASLLHDVGFLDEATAAWFVSDILEALAFLHQKRIVHRDIKAANLLIKGGVIKVADFGAAIHPHSHSTARQITRGTLIYMPPEAITGKRFGYEMDIWATGCVALEMLALDKGTRVYDAEFLTLRFMDQLAASPNIPQTLSPAAHNFLSMCLAKIPTHRAPADQLLQHTFIASVTRSGERKLRPDVAMMLQARQASFIQDCKNLDSGCSPLPASSGKKGGVCTATVSTGTVADAQTQTHGETMSTESAGAGVHRPLATAQLQPDGAAAVVSALSRVLRTNVRRFALKPAEGEKQSDD